MGGEQPEPQCHHEAEQREPGEHQERHGALDEGLTVGVERDVVDVLLSGGRQGCDPDQGDAGELDAAQHLAVLERDGQHLGSDTDRRQGVDHDRRHRERPADPGADAFGTTEVELCVAVIEEQVHDRTEHDGQCQQHAERTDQCRPGEQRHPAHGHAGGPGGEHRRRHTAGRGQQTRGSSGRCPARNRSTAWSSPPPMPPLRPSATRVRASPPNQL